MDKSGRPKAGGIDLQSTALLAGGPTPTVEDHKQDGPKVAARIGTPEMKLTDQRLRNFALMAGWPTPMAGSPGTEGYNPAGNTDSSRKTMELLAGWCTPAARDHKDTPGMATTATNPDGTERTRLDMLPRQAALTGPTPASSSAETAKPAAFRLNPAFSLWLMGYPAAWLWCVPVSKASPRFKRKATSDTSAGSPPSEGPGTRSSRKRPRSSSALSSK